MNDSSRQGLTRIAVILSLLVVISMTAASAAPQFERIGIPCTIKELHLQLVAPDGAGGYMAWGDYEDPDQRAIVGFDIETGEMTWVDITRFGMTHIALCHGLDGRIYVYAGNPAHFLAYDMQTGDLEDLGVPASPANYLGHGMRGPDGKFYMGSYPGTHLVAVDTTTGEIEHLAKIAEDPRENYLWPNVAISDDGVVYGPVGLHHRELWSYDTRTGEKRQILPEEFTEDQGRPSVWYGEDGQVYGSVAGVKFLCQPDRIVRDVEVAPEPDELPGLPRTADGKRIHRIDEQGRLTMTDLETGEAIYVQTEYDGQPQMIYSIGCLRDGKIWGGALFPSNTWYYDPDADELVDLGVIVRGGCQIYDLLSVPQGILMGSYTGAYIDLYDPQEELSDTNPYHFARVPMQERPNQFEMGPDGRVYVGTIPVKGRLGGALVRIDLDAREIDSWANIIENQSITYCAAIPETGELLCGSTIAGGSSAQPTEDEAYVFIWDCDAEQIVHTDQPVPGTRTYGRVIRAETGTVYGIAGNQYFAYDPVARETVYIGDLPGERVHFPGLSDDPVAGLIYGLVDDRVFAIDPADHSVKVVAEHESISRAHGFHVTPEGVLYYGSGPDLWRCDLTAE